MRRILYVLLIFPIIAGCKSEPKSERMARQYCASCHLFPEPGLLDKETWAGPVMRQMAFRMGLPRLSEATQIPLMDLNIVQSILPAQPMISEQELQLITDYYRKEAPDSLIVPLPSVSGNSTLFKSMEFPLVKSQSITLLKFNSADTSLYVGTRKSHLMRIDGNLRVADSIQLQAPLSHIMFFPDRLVASEMGNMDPNDQSKGRLLLIGDQFSVDPFIDSLKRPVFFDIADFDNDGYDDYVICNYGNYTGELAIFFSNANGNHERAVLSQLPGARKVVVSDFDKNGYLDVLALITQGDEKLSIFYNLGGRAFTEKVIQRFPPVYGSNYLEVADFNNDGYPDILTTNGDNADYSVIMKPYHGVRIFENDQSNGFKEVWNYPMPGASQAAARDFDGDGDLDISAISFFPDERGNEKHGFIYLNNDGGYHFTPLRIPGSNSGRWLVMETADFDLDNDVDIFLGTFDLRGSNLPIGGLKHEGISILLLENTLN